MGIPSPGQIPSWQQHMRAEAKGHWFLIKDPPRAQERLSCHRTTLSSFLFLVMSVCCPNLPLRHKSKQRPSSEASRLKFLPGSKLTVQILSGIRVRLLFPAWQYACLWSMPICYIPAHTRCPRDSCSLMSVDILLRNVLPATRWNFSPLQDSG